jgi:hypothetical protein
MGSADTDAGANLMLDLSIEDSWRFRLPSQVRPDARRDGNSHSSLRDADLISPRLHPIAAMFWTVRFYLY